MPCCRDVLRLRGYKTNKDWGYYTSVDVVDKTTAVVVIKGAAKPRNIIRACLLRRQP